MALVEPGFTRTAIAQNQQLADAPVPAYAAARDRVLGVVTAGVEGEATPEGVAAVIHEAASARHPRLRYPVGRDAAVLDALRRLLPERLFSRALRRQFALDVAGS